MTNMTVMTPLSRTTRTTITSRFRSRSRSPPKSRVVTPLRDPLSLHGSKCSELMVATKTSAASRRAVV